VNVSTELRMSGGQGVFVARTEEPDLCRALRQLAFSEADGAFVRAFPADAPGLHESYVRFKRTLEDVLAQASGRRITPWEEALDAVVVRLGSLRAEWFLVGSGALAVRGIEVVPHDLDLVVADPSLAAEAFRHVEIEPVSDNRPGSWIARWFGRAFLHARIEWIAEVDPAADTYAAPNDYGPLAASRLEIVRWRDHDLAVAPLDHLLAVTERRGLAERAAAIRDFLGG
jgi:hypothetical protein